MRIAPIGVESGPFSPLVALLLVAGSRYVEASKDVALGTLLDHHFRNDNDPPTEAKECFRVSSPSLNIIYDNL